MTLNKFEPITGLIVRAERRFICTKPHLLFNYLNDNAEYLHNYKTEQKYYGRFEYRQYRYNGEVSYYKHTLGTRAGIVKRVEVEEISEGEYNVVSPSRLVSKFRIAYHIKDTTFTLNIDTYDKDKILVEVWDLSEYRDKLANWKAPKGLVEVTGNLYYDNKYIAEHPSNIVTKPLIIVEGTDLIGKSTVVEMLIKSGYVCLDRDQYGFSNHVTLFEKPETMVNKVRYNYAGRDNYRIIIMYTSDNSILDERLISRITEHALLSEYDFKAADYNCIYHQMLNQFLDEGDKEIISIDVFGKTPDMIIDELLKEIKAIK